MNHQENFYSECVLFTTHITKSYITIVISEQYEGYNLIFIVWLVYIAAL